jgi:hypothetical protein
MGFLSTRASTTSQSGHCGTHKGTPHDVTLLGDQYCFGFTGKQGDWIDALQMMTAHIVTH